MKELINKINELIKSISTQKDESKRKDDRISELENDLFIKNKDILSLQEELEMAKKGLDLTELNEAISKLEEVING